MSIGKLDRLSRDYTRIEKAIEFIEENARTHPCLADIAGAAGLSEFHFQRLFSRWVGISPKRFLQFLTKEHAKTLLDDSASILDTAYETGLSGPGRLHDLFMAWEAVTPGAYKKKGEGLTIRFGFSPSPFGECMIAGTGKGLCALSFVRNRPPEEIKARLSKAWPRAVLIREDSEAQALAARIFTSPPPREPAPLQVFIKGNQFQLKVWEALTRIPLGRTVTYQDLARHIGSPGAVRAVGTAVGKNPLPYLIPCHRVIRKTGAFGNYGEGRSRKKAILGWESASLIPLKTGRPAG